MFTGLVREIAKIKNIHLPRLRIHSSYKPLIGDSVAINGACLTVTKTYEDGFEVELSHHSSKSLALERLQGEVHLEPALKSDSRLDGHIVQGHIDGVGILKKISITKNQTHFFIQAPRKILSLCPPKGSVCVDGISLTITTCLEDSFELILIPHTMQNTLFKNYKIGMRVHIETDMILRGMTHFLSFNLEDTKNPYQKTSKNRSNDWRDLDKIIMEY